MRIHERLFLNPFEKWFRHGKFPMAFLFHILLLVLVSMQVLFYVARDVDHIWRTTRHLSSLFLNIREGKLTISRPVDMQDALANVVVTYFDINNASLVHYEFLDHDLLKAMIKFRNGTDMHMSLTREHFKEPGYLHSSMPFLFDNQLQTVEFISMTCGFLEKMPEGSHWPWLSRAWQSGSHLTYTWHLALEFDGSVVGEFWGRLRSKVGTVAGADIGNGVVLKDMLNFVVLIIAVICIGLISKKVCRSSRIGLAMRRRIAAARAEAEQHGDGSFSNVDVLPWGALFSSWWIVSIASHALQIAASLTCLQPTDDLTRRFSLLGWSCFFTWMSICQYFEFFPAYYTTFSTTQNGLISICKYMISVIPIFTAFMFLGMCLFWQVESFRSPSVSYASLFSMLNGDSIRRTFTDVEEGAGWLSTLYLYLFIFVFTYIVLNVNITIIQESFIAAKSETPELGAGMPQAHRDGTWTSALEERPLESASGVSLQEWVGLTSPPERGIGTRQTSNSNPGSPEFGRATLLDEHSSNAEQLSRRGSTSSIPGSDDLSKTPPRRGSQEPLLHPPELMDAQVAPGSRQRRRSTSPSMPSVTASFSDSSCRRMSPRFTRNPRLQRTLAVAFPEDLPNAQESVAGGTNHESTDSQWSIDLEGFQPSTCSAGFSLSSGTQYTSTEAPSTDLITPANTLLWTTTLPLLTHALRTMAPPSMEELGGTCNWQDLEARLLEHCEAASIALARLRMARVDRGANT